MALQKDPTPIKEELKKFAAELVAQGGISQEELNKKVLEEKQRLEKLSQPKKDQLQETGAAVEANKASDTVSSLESGSSDSQAKTETPENILKKIKPKADRELSEVKKEETNLSFLTENNIDPYNIYTVSKEESSITLEGAEVPNGTVTKKTNISINEASDLTKQIKSSISNAMLAPSSVNGLIYSSAGYSDVYTGWNENQLKKIKEHVRLTTVLESGASLSDESFNNIYDNIYSKALAEAQNTATNKQNKNRNNYALDDKFLLKTTQDYLSEKGVAVRQKVELNTKIDNAYSNYQAASDPLEKQNYKEEIESLQQQMLEVGVTYADGVQNTLPDFAEQGQFFNITGAKNLSEEEKKKIEEKVSLYKEQGKQNAETAAKAQGISQRQAAKQEYKNSVLDLQIFNKKASEQTLTYDTNKFPYGSQFLYDLNQKGYSPDNDGIISIPIAGLYDMGLTAQDFIGALQVEGVASDGFSDQEITALKMFDEQRLELSAKADGLFDLAIVNTDPAKLETLPFIPNLIVTGARSIGQQWFGLNTDQLDKALGKTNRDRKDDLQGAIDVVNTSISEGKIDSDFITLNEEQKKAMDTTISELVSSGIGEFVPMLVELGILSYVTGGVATVTGITKALQGLKSGGVWSKTLYHGIMAITEEAKMQVAFDFAPTTGATFYAGGALTEKIGFKKKYKWLDPLFQKVIKSGPVGAVSSEGAELTTFAYKDLMGDEDFSANFNKHFGDVDENGKRLLVNAMVFGLTGVHKVKSTDLMSTQRKLKVRNDLLQKNQDMLNSVTQGKKGTEGKMPEFSVGVKKEFKDLTKSQQEQYTANLDAANALNNLFLAETNSYNFNVENPAFEKNYQEQVIDPMNRALKQVIPGYKGAKVVFGEGDKFRNKNFDNPKNKAEYDPNSNTMYFDKSKFNLALGNHEIFHASVNAYFTENPKAAKNFTKKMSEVFAGKEIAGFSAETIEKAIELGYAEEIGEQGSIRIKKNITAEEFLAFTVETLSNPEFYYSNKDLAGSLLGQVKLDLKNFMGEYVSGFKPQTANDILRIFASLGESVRTGGKITEKIKVAAELDKINVLGYEVNSTLEKVGLGERFASKEIDLAKEKIESEIEALEKQLENDEIDYDTYESRLVTLENKLEAAEEQGESAVTQETKAKPKVKREAKPVRTTDLGPRDPRSQKIMDTYNEGTEGQGRTNYNAKNPLPGGLESKLVPQFEGYINTIVDQKFRQTTDEAFNKEDALAVLRAEIPKALRTFNPDKNKDLAGYVKKLIQTRQSLMFKDVNKEFTTDIDTAKGITTESKLTGSNDTRPEPTLIEPVERLVKDPDLKAEFIEKVNEATKNLDPKKVNYKNLTDAAPELTEKIFGEVFKEVKGKTKLDKAKTLKLQQQFIRNNARILYKLLPEGARKRGDGFSTSTGIQSSLLKNFYEKGERPDMTEGTEAGLATQTKKPYNETAFLEAFGANKGQEPNRNDQTAVNALKREIGRAMTNVVYRQELGATDVPMKTIQQIADGKSVNMASKDLEQSIGKAFLENKVTEEDFKNLVSTVSKNLPKYYGELAPEITNSADKQNVLVNDVVAKRILTEAKWNLAYEESGIEYTKLSEVGNDTVGKDGKVERPELVKGLKILAEEFGDIESLPTFIRKTLLATLGVNRRVLINGNKISQKATGTTNSKDMLNKVFGELNFKDGSQNLDYKYAYAPTPGKGKWNKAEVGGKGFNGKVESKIASLREKYKNNTDSNEFRQELSDFVRNELTHPDLRGQADGFELTVQANKKLLQKTYNTIYDSVKSGKLSLKGAADLLRIQTDHGTGIFKLLVPYESVTMGGIGKYRKGDKKNTHNEHMIELQNYNLDFLEILKKSENPKEDIAALVDGLGQAIIDVPTQRVKDSKRFGGSSKQVYADKVLNTFLRTNSLNNSLIISGDYEGYTQGERLFQELGSDGLRKALDRVDSKRRGKQWTEISEALNKLKERKLASKDLSEEFGKIVTEKTNITGNVSDIVAKIEGKDIGKYNPFVPHSADDFPGLMNYNAGKGKKGEADQEFFKKNLYEPYAKAYTLLNRQNVQMAKQFKEIKKHVKTNSPNFKLTKKLPGSKFTYEQALRVAIWDKQGYEIPGLSKVETENLKKVIDSNVDLQVLALNLKRIAGGEYIKPGKDWYAGDIASDLRQGLNTTLRSKYLTEWKNNVDAMFTPEILNKLEAAHGTSYRKSLENMLDAMYTGKTRRTSPNSLEGRSLNYLNNSVGTIMFLNQRSATLQMLSSFNYINWSDNNPLRAGKALANIPQFAKDFKTLFNSDWAKSRREGLRINVTESEIAEAVNGSKNIPKSITSFLLKKGFLPTQIADSMATALGGASFYRNRTNTYVKEGMTQEKAEAKAMQDWVEISETNQQSSRPDKISMQQRSDLGKLLLAFANTPMQYTRETKKALLDIKNKRGDLKTNLSKVAYYTFVQNAIFSGLQSAIFKMAWSDDEQDQIFLEKKAPKIINSMGDSFLRGMGIGGALISTLKNAGIKLYERSDRGGRGRLKDVAFDLLDVSPPVSSKVGKVYSALDAIDRAGGFEAATQAPVDLKNPLIKSGALMTEALGNIPANRALQKIQTITEAASSNREWYEKLALMSGWKSWEIDPEVVYKSREEKTAERKAKRKEVFEKMPYKEYQVYKKWKKLKVNNGKDIIDFVETRKGK